MDFAFYFHGFESPSQAQAEMVAIFSPGLIWGGIMMSFTFSRYIKVRN
jgi:hypothetical protein